MTSQHVYAHRFRSGQVRRILMNHSEKEPGRVYSELEFKVQDLPATEQTELMEWMGFIKKELEGRGFRLWP